ncbi:unnamed protein product [Psylliodes chrysocephalus]|uniref:BED-type domain-containing protein n=1 Tax=Psylliodes chrysocephalus TaxID=3402493 RepID=A0A9P0CQM3_9CUCU|nr:unnamed protein product [Psylliodes chrysocephala]
MDRKKSTLWSFFQPTTDQKATCNLCRQNISYKTSISNLKRHLQRKHPLVNITSDDGRTNNSVPSSKKNQNTKENSLIQPSSSSSENNDKHTEENLVVQPSTSTAQGQIHNSTVQTKLPYFPKKMGLQQKTKIDRSLMDLFIKDFQPFRVVEDEGFRNFTTCLNPSYELPNRKTISNTHLPALYEETLKNVQREIGDVKSVTLTTDCWTSVSTESYMAVTVHFISNNFQTKSILLDCIHLPQSHTSENLAKELKQIVVSWGLQNQILLAISDNAANIKKAIQDILKWKHLGCYAHTLNLIVGDALSVVDDFLKKIRQLVGHFKRSTTAAAKLAEVQSQQGKIPKKLLQDVSTRWNSTFYMLERLLEIEEAVRTTMALLNSNTLPIISVEEWQLLNELKIVLEPMEKLTKIMSGQNYTTLSSVIVLTKGLEANYNKLNENKETYCTFALTQTIVQKILDGIQRRLGDLENSNTLFISTFLDPRFKNIGFSNDGMADKAKKLVTALVTELIYMNPKQIEQKDQNTPVENLSSELPQKKPKVDFSPWDQFDRKAASFKPSGTSSSRAIVEVQRYLEDDPLDRHEDPLLWWRQHAYNYPNLSKVFIEKFGTIATSVPCERVFSKTGQIITERRSRLNSQKVRQLIFLNVNKK